MQKAVTNPITNQFAHDEVFDACWGNPPPPSSHPPKTKGGGRNKNLEKLCVRNMHNHLGTRLSSDVTSETSPLAIEGVKDGDGKVNLACRSVKLEG